MRPFTSTPTLATPGQDALDPNGTMVLLTMTSSIAEGLKQLDEAYNDAHATGPAEAAPGKPISHGQIVDLWKKLASDDGSHSLERLLRGAQVYIPPPQPKPEPVCPSPFARLCLQSLTRCQSAQYKALMARLRHDEEARSYQRMVNPPPHTESFQDRFPHHALASASAFAEVNRPTTAADMGDDEVTLNDVHRQVTLILNFLASIIGVAVTLWVAARWWSLPARLFLTMGGALLVGVAEVAVYSGYVWRMGEAKQREDALGEVKEVVGTWVVGDEGEGEGEASQGYEDEKTVLLKSKDGEDGEDVEGAVRKRNTAAKAGT